jgi:hypothetical protein
MSGQDQNAALRKRLQDVTEAESESEYLALFNATSRDVPNSMVLLASPIPIKRYTCLMYVLGFTENPEYIAIAARGFNVVYAGPTFAHWLLEKQLVTEIVESVAESGDMVFYFNMGGRFKHAGLYIGRHRVESKWGLGHLFQHDLFEVPESYGESVSFFKKLPCRTAIEYFKEFARDNGMHLEG